MIFKSKKGRAKVLGSKSSRNSYFSRSRLIVRPSALRHLIFASIWAIWQKLCWNCLFSEFCDRGYMSVCLFLSFLFCGSDVFLLRCFFLWPCFVMKLGALPWSSCDGFVTASRTENREGFKNEHPWGVRFKPCPALPFLRNFLSHTIRGDAAMWFSTREMWLKMVLCPGPTKHTPAQPKTDLQNVTQTGPADEPNFWSPGRAQSTIFSKKNAQFFKKTPSFGHIQIQNQVLRWVQKMDLKRCPNSGTLLRKYIKIHQMWLKMVLLTGPIFDPKGELNSDTQASVTFSKKSYWKSNKNHSEDCNIWNFIAAVVGTDTDVRHWAPISFSRQLWGPHF